MKITVSRNISSKSNNFFEEFKTNIIPVALYFELYGKK